MLLRIFFLRFITRMYKILIIVLFVIFPSQTVLNLARRNTNELITSSINFKISIILLASRCPMMYTLKILFELLIKEVNVNKSS